MRKQLTTAVVVLFVFFMMSFRFDLRSTNIRTIHKFSVVSTGEPRRNANESIVSTVSRPPADLWTTKFGLDRYVNQCAARTITIAQSVGGSCYANCFVFAEIGKEQGCPCSCRFIETDLNSDQAKKADAVVQFFFTSWDGNAASVRPPSFPQDQIRVLFIGESQAHYSALLNPRYTRLYNFSIGMHLHADLVNPTPEKFVPHLFASIQLQPGRKPVKTRVQKLSQPWISAWMSNCGGPNRRFEILKAITDQGISLASYGGCLHNAEPDVSMAACLFKGGCPDWAIAGGSFADKYAQKVLSMSKHMFVFAAENSDCPWYHTEKLWHSLASGSIPVYLGATTVSQIVPTGSMIEVRNFTTASGLANFMRRVAAEQDLYDSFHAWRQRPIEPHLQHFVDERQRTLRGGTDCDICIAASARVPLTQPESPNCLPPHKLG